jgi:glycosyltransferase involved in cell wall biosynthesis
MPHTFAIDIRLLGKKRTGDETVFRELARALVSLDRENRYLFVTDETDETRLSRLRTMLGLASGTSAEIVSLPSSGRFHWNAVALPRFLRAVRPAVYHTQYILPFFIPRAVKIVLHIHDVSFQALPAYIGWKDRLFLSLLIPRSLRRADAIVAPSAFTKREIGRYYQTPAEKIRVIPNALSLLPESGLSPEALREKYALPEAFVLAIGTLQPRKNLPTLIRAVAELRERVPEAALVLVGNPEGHHFDAGIPKAIEETGLGEAVIFPGYIETPDLLGVLRLARVYAFPSLYEGFGIPMLEAFAAGVPVAASDIGALREVGGEAACYFPPRDIAACRDALYTLFVRDAERHNLISQGKERLARFSWQKSGAALRALYQELGASPR